MTRRCSHQEDDCGQKHLGSEPRSREEEDNCCEYELTQQDGDDRNDDRNDEQGNCNNSDFEEAI